MRRCFTLALVAIAIPALSVGAQTPVDTAGLQRVMIAEDLRATNAGGLATLVNAMASGDPVVRRTAVRGMGRLQKPELVAQLTDALSNSDADERAEAANALAQAVNRATRRPTDTLQRYVGLAQSALTRALATEKEPVVRGAILDALGRLPFPDSASRHAAERLIAASATPTLSFSASRGLFAMAFYSAGLGPLLPEVGAALRATVASAPDSLTRRMAARALLQAKQFDAGTAAHAIADRDDQVRRFGLMALPAIPVADQQRLALVAAHDSSVIVRVEAVNAVHLAKFADCTAISALVHDKSDYVALVAIDSMPAVCADRKAVIADLSALASKDSPSAIPDHRWQRRTHALVGLATVDPVGAGPLIATAARSSSVHDRLAAANAAAAAKQLPTMRMLAHDRDHNVQEAAIDGLAVSTRHASDSVYIETLAGSGHQVILAAAKALQGGDTVHAHDVVWGALDRLTAERRENSRDPRIALMQRAGEFGTAADSLHMARYLVDYDTLVATLAARTLGKWTGHPWQVAPVPLAVPERPLAKIALAAPVMMKVTMAASSGGGSFTVRLDNFQATATIARLEELIRAHFFDGHVFQRVEPDFVVQGGGGDASEYVGDSVFVRDELTLGSHRRGTFGISSRGRDTGDSQWFINLIDNTNLDHLYTILGRIVSGLPVAEQILEGDRIASVVVVGGKGVDVKQ